MRFVHRLVVAIYIISVGGFGLFWLLPLLGTDGPLPWSFGFYLQTVIACQIPATIIAGLIYLAVWVIPHSPDRTAILSVRFSTLI